VLLLFDGRPAGAMQAATPLLDAGDLPARLRALYVMGIAGAQLGRHELAARLSAEGFEAHAAEPTASKQPPEAQRIGGVFAALEEGRLDDATALAVSGYRTLVERGQREGQATFDMLRGLVGVAAGDIAGAELAFREGAAINRDIHDPVALRWCVAGTLMTAGMAGDTDAAVAAAAELEALPPVTARLMEIDLIGRGRAWGAVALGEVSEARARLMELAAQAVALEQRAVAVVCLHDAARLGERRAAPELRRLALQVDGPLAGLRADHAEALVAEDPAALDGVATGFEEMGALLVAAEAATEAGRLYRAQGLARAAAGAERRAGRLLSRCPGGQTPVVTGVVASGGVLTAREREIAVLAAGGLSSKDIAGRLVVSARTVDNHLQRVYAKLGISGRDELRSALDAR
jgi:ATP/maltotriose-dependent transcriptional regulator MalT